MMKKMIAAVLIGIQLAEDRFRRRHPVYDDGDEDVFPNLN